MLPVLRLVGLGVEVVEARPVGRRVVRLQEDPVLYFMSRLGEDGQAHAQSQLRLFFRWLNQQPGYAGITPKALLVRQLQAEDEYEIVDVIQKYLDSKHDLRAGSKRQVLRILRSFFRKNRCPLPPDAEFTIRSDLPPTESKLTVKELHAAVLGLPPLWQSLYAVKYMALLDTKRLAWMGLHSADQVVRQLRAGELPVRVDLPCGRKKNANERGAMYFTYFGRDAAESLKRYFTETRGWPGPGEPIWLYEERKPKKNKDSRSPPPPPPRPVTRKNVGQRWIRIMRRLKFVPKMGHAKNLRYGYHLHEMRDVATTELHVRAKGRGLDMDCVKFWCGQVGQLDRNKYDKFYKEQDYVRDQYKIAEPFLNILTGPIGDQELKKLSQENQELKKRLAGVEFAVRMLQDASGLKVTPGQPSEK